MLAKNVGISVSVVEMSKEMDSARAILQLQKSASEEELLSTLQRLTVQCLKFLCKETAVKSSRIKAEIIGRLITSWKKLCDVRTECDGEEQQSRTFSSDAQGTSKPSKTSVKRNLPTFETIREWTSKDISPIKKYWYMNMYEYLVNSTDSTFDKESMKAFKSLKAYKYFSDGLVSNVWAHHLEDEVVVRGYCLSSLKAKTVYTVYVVIKTTGDVVGGTCNCVAGKGEACSHVAALLFYGTCHNKVTVLRPYIRPYSYLCYARTRIRSTPVPMSCYARTRIRATPVPMSCYARTRIRATPVPVHVRVLYTLVSIAVPVRNSRC